MSSQELDWPPPYTIRVSNKSKRISLRITSHKGLEIVIPKRTGIQRALDFLNLKYDWVQKHRHLLVAKKDAIALPDTLDLLTINETWHIKYGQISLKKRLFSSEATQTLLVKDEKDQITPAIIKKWLLQKASKHLPLMLRSYSKEYKLPFEDFSIRFQHSRWGSCSKDKNISLNCKLLLLPLEYTHYVMVHELVHTIHFDHSKAFWQAVAAIIPEHKHLRAELKNMEQALPNWLY